MKYKTNSKHVKEIIKQHILNVVTDEEENLYLNIHDAANRLNNEFKRVANHRYNLKRIPNDKKRFSDYLLGLPFNFEYYHESIKDFLNGLGINPENKEFDTQKSIDLYHYLIFREMNNNL